MHMMKVEKVIPHGNTSIEDALNEFFKRERISKDSIAHIRPVSMYSIGGISDVVWVYVFYDDGQT